MNDMIHCQRDIPRDQLRYGFRASADTGCGWIATYNALRLMGKRAEPEALIRWYERQLPLLHGNTGTIFFAPALFFKHHGFQTRLEARREKFDALVAESQACILFYYWRSKWKVGAHFVALHKTDRGIFGYNTYKNSSAPDPYGDSLAEFLKKRGYFGCVLLGIREEEGK